MADSQPRLTVLGEFWPKAGNWVIVIDEASFGQQVHGSSGDTLADRPCQYQIIVVERITSVVFGADCDIDNALTVLVDAQLHTFFGAAGNHGLHVCAEFMLEGVVDDHAKLLVALPLHKIGNPPDVTSVQLQGVMPTVQSHLSVHAY